MSTEEQANNGYSVRAQEEKLISFCKIKDWNLYDIYIDEGISGKNINDRENLLRLLNDIKLRNISNVLVYKIDRLTRSTKDLIDLIDLFNGYDCSFNSLCESIDTKSSTGRMFIKIIGIFAEFERENIIERVKLGLERKVKEGFTIASKNISYGYFKKKGNNVQEIDYNEALVVNKIYDWFLEGKSYTLIANILNNENIKTKNGNEWSYKTIKSVLTNPNYIGRVRYGINTNKYFEREGKHEAILSIDKYNRVQEKILNLRVKNGLFTGRFFCSCGSCLKEKKYFYNSKNKKSVYIRYNCNNKFCCFKSINEVVVDKYLCNIIDSWRLYTYKEKKEYISKYINKIVVYDCYFYVLFSDNMTNLSNV